MGRDRLGNHGLAPDGNYVFLHQRSGCHPRDTHGPAGRSDLPQCRWQGRGHDHVVLCNSRAVLHRLCGHVG